MRKYLLLFSLIVFVGFVFVSLRTIKQKVRSDISAPLDSQNISSPTAIPTIDVKKNPSEKTFLFIPYWTITTEEIQPEEYDLAIYFGVTPTSNGINKSEAGYAGLSKFIDRTPAWKQRYITLRMLDSKINFAILEDEKKQENVIREFIELAAENGFDGIILDLELTALPFDSVISQINHFSRKLSSAAANEQLSFSMMVYGDTFYRVRPFEIKTLATYSDQLYIMAYDFPKAKGNPGPNFPLSGKEEFGYDYTTLISNFIQVVPPKKLAVVFGMYGYDWKVDDKNTSTELAEAVSMNKVTQSIITTCRYRACTWKRDPQAGEIMAEYKDENNARHIIWFEDIESVNRKKEYLKKQGITTFAFWAYSYY